MNTRLLISVLAFCSFTAVAALEWQQAEAHRYAPLLVPNSGKAGFTLMQETATGIHFTNSLPEPRLKTNQVLLNGSGVALGDVNGDGLCDIYFAQLDGPNHLYLNKGNWKFQETAAASGVACEGMDSSGVAIGDLDGDNDLDLVVNSVGQGTRIFYNDAKGKFTERHQPFNTGRGASSLALGDLNGDGFLDIYIANYRFQALMDMPNTHFTLKRLNGQVTVDRVNGRPVTEPDLADRFLVSAKGGIEERGEPDLILISDRGTNFNAMSHSVFLDEDGNPLKDRILDWGLSVMIRDINQDRLPDIYVANDFDSPDRLWISQGNGTFRAIPRLAVRKLSMFSMGVDFADINRDGHDDFFLLDMLSRDHAKRMNFIPAKIPATQPPGIYDNRPEYARNTLFLNRGNGTYAEIAPFAGVDATEWAWCPLFLDVDLDGLEDLLVTNGHERDARNDDVAEELKRMRVNRKMSNQEIIDARKLFPRLAIPNLAYRNQGDLTFKDMSAEWGFDFTGVSHGMAAADLDNDGDMDLVVNNLNGPAAIYRNEIAVPRLAIRLKGVGSNTRGIGARITVKGGPVEQSQEIIAGGRYLSSDDPMRVFAAGTNDLAIEVKWRSGKVTRLAGLKPNRIYEIEERGEVEKTQPQKIEPLFVDASDLLNHQHQEMFFQDFELQPLLPRRLSQGGPGVTWADLNGDTWEDLLIGAGKGGQLALYLNDQKGKFNRVNALPFSIGVVRDLTTVLPWARGGQLGVLAGSANYEDAQADGSVVLQYQGQQLLAPLPGSPWSTGPIAIADINGDGSLDMFVGASVMTQTYPEPASSKVFQDINGRWQADDENTARFERVGLVNGAVFSDLDADGDPDLVLACDWGSLRIFRNHAGKLQDDTASSGLANLKGWWNGVITRDFDGDGRMDIAASNWGKNTRWEKYRAKTLRVYYGDFNGDQITDLVEAYYDEASKKYVPERTLDSLSRTLPFIRERFKNNADYSRASVEEILGAQAAKAKILEANWLENTLFLNRGKTFEARPLPKEAQLSPAFGICAGDFNGDGHEDLFLAQNFFATHPEHPRDDAGVGLLLLGDGKGAFAAMGPIESGIWIYGEQRGAAAADFDKDGRLDLLIGQNGAATKLFRNTRATPGLRLKLDGPPANPLAIGAKIRLYAGDKLLATREIQAGSGYWSQSSPLQILHTPSGARLEVHWPNGKTTNHKLAANEKEIQLRSE